MVELVNCIIPVRHDYRRFNGITICGMTHDSNIGVSAFDVFKSESAGSIRHISELMVAAGVVL